MLIGKYLKDKADTKSNLSLHLSSIKVENQEISHELRARLCDQCELRPSSP